MGTIVNDKVFIGWELAGNYMASLDKKQKAFLTTIRQNKIRRVLADWVVRHKTPEAIYCLAQSDKQLDKLIAILADFQILYEQAEQDYNVYNACLLVDIITSKLLKLIYKISPTLK